MIGAGEVQKGALDLGAGGRDHDCTAMLGVLDRGEADAARRGMDQDIFAGGKFGQRAEGVDRGDEHHRDGRRRCETRLRRYPHDRLRSGNDMRPERGRRQAGHPVADRQILDPSADRSDDAGAFQSESRTGKTVDQRLFGQQPHRPHRVAEIEASGVHLDRHLARSDVARRCHLPAQCVEPAGPVAGQPERVAALGPPRRQPAAQAEHMASGRGPDDFGIRSRHRQLGKQPRGELSPAKRRRYIDQPKREPRDLIDEDPPKTPQRRADEAEIGSGRALLRTTRNDPQRNTARCCGGGDPRDNGDQRCGLRRRLAALIDDEQHDPIRFIVFRFCIGLDKPGGIEFDDAMSGRGQPILKIAVLGGGRRDQRHRE